MNRKLPRFALILVWAWAAMPFGLWAQSDVSGPSPEPPQPWEYSPYKIQVWLAAAPDPQLSPEFQVRLAEELALRFESLIGAPWRAQVISAPSQVRSSMWLKQELPPAQLLEAVPEALRFDKIILLTLEANSREFTVRTQELDCRARLYGAPFELIARQPQSLVQACYTAVIEVFRPVTRIEDAESKSAVVRLRAGGLVLDPDSPCYVGEDDILQPVLRTNERDGTFRSIMLIDWTYLEVKGRDTHNPQLLDCRVWSGRPNPIQGRVSSRKEQYALKVRPPGGTTRLFVNARVGRNEQIYPMPGLEVYAKIPEEPLPTPAPTAPPSESVEGTASDSDPPAAGSSESAPTEPQPPATPAPKPPEERSPPVLLGHTDWRGMIEVGSGDSPLRLVYLKNGGQLLARLPIVPGLMPTLVVDVPDDAPRLAAEGFVKGLQGQMMDLEAQRRILAERIRLRIKERKLAEADQLLEELKQLPTRNDLVRQLDQQQNQQVVSPNAIVQGRIDRLYGQTREALGKYLAPSLINDLIGEINQARGSSPAAAPEATAATTPGG